MTSEDTYVAISLKGIKDATYYQDCDGPCIVEYSVFLTREKKCHQIYQMTLRKEWNH